MSKNTRAFNKIFSGIIAIILLALLFGVQTTKQPIIKQPKTPTVTQPQVSITVNPNATCHIQGALPDPNCTPGSTNQEVTQANIQQTICVRGYTKTIRPPASYTDQLKIQQIAQYGYSDTNSRDYEEDHLISLELGGAPSDPKNLWPEPGRSPNPKDKIENLCHEKVCSGQLSLSDAQHQIATNWQTACQ